MIIGGKVWTLLGCKHLTQDYFLCQLMRERVVIIFCSPYPLLPWAHHKFVNILNEQRINNSIFGARRFGDIMGFCK